MQACAPGRGRRRARSAPAPRAAGWTGRGRAGTIAAAVLALFALWLAVGGALAQDDRAPVLIDGREVFRVGPAGEVAASERARLIQRRIDLLLASPEEIGPARVEPPGPDGERQVSVAGVPIVTVTEDDADDNVTTVNELAASWAADLDRELGAAADRRQTTLARFITEIRAAFAAAFVRLYGTMVGLVPRLLAAGLVLGLFWLVSRLAGWVLRFSFGRTDFNPTFENLVRSVVAVSIWATGALAAAAAFGFDPQTVVTGLGLTSLALGFGLRDVVSNYVSGVLILVLRPFALGDWVAIGETEGTVEQIDLRATKIRTFDGAVVLIPNGDVFVSRIVKNTDPVRRTDVRIMVAPDADLDRAVSVVLQAVGAVPGVLGDPLPSVRVAELRPDAAVLEARYWTDSRATDVLATADAARRAGVDALRAAGVELPAPGVRSAAPAP